MIRLRGGKFAAVGGEPSGSSLTSAPLRATRSARSRFSGG